MAKVNKEISEYMSQIGKRGLKSRWSKMTAKQRSEHARWLANKRWQKLKLSTSDS